MCRSAGRVGPWRLSGRRCRFHSALRRARTQPCRRFATSVAALGELRGYTHSSCSLLTVPAECGVRMRSGRRTRARNPTRVRSKVWTTTGPSRSRPTRGPANTPRTCPVGERTPRRVAGIASRTPSLIRSRRRFQHSRIRRCRTGSAQHRHRMRGSSSIPRSRPTARPHRRQGGKRRPSPASMANRAGTATQANVACTASLASTVCMAQPTSRPGPARPWASVSAAGRRHIARSRRRSLLGRVSQPTRVSRVPTGRRPERPRIRGCAWTRSLATRGAAARPRRPPRSAVARVGQASAAAW